MQSEPDPRIQGFIDAIELFTGIKASDLNIVIRRRAPPLYPEGEVFASQQSVETSPVGEQRVSAETVRRTADTQTL